MKLPIETQHLIDQYVEVVRHDPEHKLNPVQRIPIYESFNSNGSEHGNLAFLKLQIITARYVLPIWKEAQPNDQLAEDLLQMAEQILQKDIDKEFFKDRLQEIWVDMDLADAYSTYPDAAFNMLAAAFEALRIMVEGFDNWTECEFSADDTNDDLSMWGNDSAKWASIAYAGWIMDTNSSFNQKRLEFWEWWLTEAIPQAWDLANQPPL